MRRLTTILGSATALFAAFSSSALAVDATLPDPNYPGGRALVYMVKVVAEQRLGLEIGIERTNAVPVIWKAMGPGARARLTSGRRCGCRTSRRWSTST